MATNDVEGVSVEQVVREARVAIHENAPLYQMSILISTAQKRVQETPIQANYKIGEVLNTCHGDPDRFGKDAVRLLENRWYSDRRKFRRCMLFARLFSPDEMETMVAMENQERGWHLTWDHINYVLVDYLSREQALDLLRRAAEQGWKAKELMREVQKLNVSEKKTHGRGHARPDTMGALLAQMEAVINQVVVKNGNVWNCSDREYGLDIFSIEPGNITEENYGKLTSVQSTIALAATVLHDLTDQLDYIRGKWSLHLREHSPLLEAVADKAAEENAHNVRLLRPNEWDGGSEVAA